MTPRRPAAGARLLAAPTVPVPVESIRVALIHADRFLAVGDLPTVEIVADWEAVGVARVAMR
jgi:hypothetical protein